MRWVLGLTALCMTLAGCGPRVITVQGGVERTFTCQCLQDKALDYAILTARELGMDPTFINTNGFSVTTNDGWGIPTKMLDVTLWPKDPAATGIMVHTGSSDGAEQLANDFTAVFIKASNP
jgi:hypothetical protein